MLVVEVFNTVHSYRQLLAQLVAIHPEVHRQGFVENQYLDKNVASMIKLVAARAKISLCLEFAGYPIREVQANSWQTELLHVKRGTPRLARKAQAVALMSLLTGIDRRKIRSDSADAFCIALWGRDRV